MIDALPGWSERLVWAGVTIAVALVVARLLRVLVRHWTNLKVEETQDLNRLRRRETAAALLSTGLRYVVFLIAAFAIIGILVQNRLTAASGATLILLVLAFGAQRFLNDIIAGFFILFENQFGVGDFITVDPMVLSGVVEEFGLRTTVLRDLNGDRYFVPNGQIMAVRRSVRRYRTYNIEVLTRDPDQVSRALEDIASLEVVGGARFLRPPRVAEARDLGDYVTLVRIRADLPPTMEWLAERFLVEALKSRVGDAIIAEPLVYTLDQAAVQRYERTVLVR